MRVQNAATTDNSDPQRRAHSQQSRAIPRPSSSPAQAQLDSVASAQYRRRVSPNPYYAPEQQRAAQVRQLFTRIALRYGLMNDLMSFGLHRVWKKKTALAALGDRQSSPLPRAPLVLDLCCGTGDLARELAARKARVVGVDFTPAMLTRARERGGIARWVCGDALRLPFSDECFDAITIGYGLRNLADFEQGVREMRRVLRRGGRIVILDFGIPECRVWRALYRAWLRVAVPLLGGMLVGDRAAYRYILTSLEHYPAQEGIARLLKQNGFTLVRLLNLFGGVSSVHVAERDG